MSPEAQQFLGEIQEQNEMASDPEYASLQSILPPIGTLRFLLYFSWAYQRRCSCCIRHTAQFIAQSPAVCSAPVLYH